MSKTKKKHRKKKGSLEMKKIRKDHPREKLVEVLLTNVPEELKDRFHHWCKNREYTMTGRIRRFMKDAVMGKHED